MGSDAAHDGRFNDAIATIAATLHGRPKDELVGEDVRRRRSVVRVVRGVVATLVVLALLATSAAVIAVRQRDTAVEQSRVARSRQLGAQATATLEIRLDRALLLAVEAVRTAPTVEALGSLLDGVNRAWAMSRFLTGHEGRVNTIAVSRDGRSIASGDSTGLVLVWGDGGDDRVPERLEGHGAAVVALAFAPDDVLVTADVDGEVIRWGRDGHRVTSFRVAATPIVFDAGGTSLAVASSGHPSVEVLDARDGSRIGSPIETGTDASQWDPYSPPAAAFSPDGNLLAVEVDGGVGLWEPRTGTTAGRRFAAAGSDDVAALAFGTDGTELIGTDVDGRECIWDVAGSALVGCTEAFGSGTALAAGATGLAASSGADRWIELNDVASGADVYELFGHGAQVTALAFSPDGARLVAGDADGVIIVWDPERRDADAAMVQTLAYLEAAPEDEIDELAWGSSPVAIDPSGRRVAAATPSGLVIWEAGDGRLHDPGSWRQRALLPIQLDFPQAAIAFSPDGRSLITAAPDDGVRRWDIDREEAVGDRLLPPSDASLEYGVGFTPDGAALVAAEADTGTGDMTVHVWDAATGRQRASITAAAPSESVFVPLDVTDTTIAYVAGDRLVLADLRTGQEKGRIVVEGGVQDVALSPDGQVLAAVVDRRVLLWDAARGDLLGELVSHSDDIMSVAFTDDGAMLASGAMDWTLSLWDVATRRQLGPPLVSAGSVVRALAFADDGTTLIGAADAALFTVDLDTSSWIDRACEVADRNLTDEEWQQYLPDTSRHETCPSAGG